MKIPQSTIRLLTGRLVKILLYREVSTMKWKGKKDHRGLAVSKIPGRTDGKYNGRHTTDE